MPYLLRFFFDPGSGVCLWAANDAARERYGYPVAACDLPVPQALRDEISHACNWFDSSIDWSNPAGHSPWSREDVDRFRALTDGLLLRLRNALGSEFEIRDERG
jgi:hypothetical protein